MHCYLGGPIDFTDDGGRGWRQEITQKLETIGVPHNRILDPTNKKELLTHPYIKSNNEGELMQQCREAGDIDGLEKIMKDVVHIDLAMVDKADFLIVNFPPLLSYHEDELILYATEDALLKEVSIPAQDYRSFHEWQALRKKLNKIKTPTYFTIHEIVIACQQKKPVFVIWPPDGVKSASAWLIFMAGQENIFTNMDDCVNKINDIMHGRAEIDPTKWLLFK
jgi:hypothetical protein